MIAVDRRGVPVPAILTKVYAKDGKAELERAIAHFIEEGKTTKFDFDRYSASEVKQALDTIFHGKCAYCESFYAKTQPVDVEHYWPIGSVDDAPDHRGYWWPAMDWDNLVPSCIDCNRRRGQRTPMPEEDGSMVAMNERGILRGARHSIPASRLPFRWLRAVRGQAGIRTSRPPILIGNSVSCSTPPVIIPSNIWCSMWTAARQKNL